MTDQSNEGSGYILTREQSDAGSAGIFSRGTNRTQEARVYSHEGPIRLPGTYISLSERSTAPGPPPTRLVLCRYFSSVGTWGGTNRRGIKRIFQGLEPIAGD
eukprot:3941973-Pyramimonas_sp.AAC.1